MKLHKRKEYPVRRMQDSYNLVGRKFGKITVLEKLKERYTSPKGKKHIRWRCVCECGREKITTTNNLCMGNSSSCGCMSFTTEVIERRARGNIKEKTGLVEIYGSYRRNAKKRGYDFEISFEDVEDITRRNCFYCDKKPEMVINKSSIPYTYNGIDRMDNTKGYISGNCVPCCRNCNKAKMDLSYEDFISMVGNIYRNIIEK